MSAPFEAGPVVWNNKPFPPQAERLVLPNGQILRDAVIWPGFCLEELGLDPDLIWEQFKAIPTWPDDQPIPFRPEGDDPHWINGSHPNLNYRGNALKRGKIWCQSDYASGLRRYGYTGWQHAVSFATHAVEHLPAMEDLAARINAGLSASGQKCHNHFIITRYETGEDNIGFHSDKDGDYAEESWFIVIKLGASRVFAFREVVSKNDPEPQPFFSRVLPAGTAIFVRAKGAGAANNLVQHAVPPMEGDVGPSGSIVTRCIETVRPWEEVARGITKAKKAKLQAKAKKAKPKGPVAVIAGSNRTTADIGNDSVPAKTWAPELVSLWATGPKTKAHCRAAVRILAATGLAIPTDDLNAAVGSDSKGALVGGLQAWARAHQLPRPLGKAGSGGYQFATDELRLTFRQVLCPPTTPAGGQE